LESLEIQETERHGLGPLRYAKMSPQGSGYTLLDGNLCGQPVDDIAAALAREKVPFVFITGYGRQSLPKASANAGISASLLPAISCSKPRRNWYRDPEQHFACAIDRALALTPLTAAPHRLKRSPRYLRLVGRGVGECDCQGRRSRRPWTLRAFDPVN
jgi:hypothetical protein